MIRQALEKVGFETRKPERWSWAWLLMWLVFAPGVIASAFHVDIEVWIPIAIIGFGLPELTSILRKNDRFPPLTHALRHFVPNYLTFPLIYFSLGWVGAHWLEFSEPLHIGALMGLLGWLTDHFTVTYAADDPYPFDRGGVSVSEARVRRLPT